jgi:Ca-activated chloride channel family protein
MRFNEPDWLWMILFIPFLYAFFWKKDQDSKKKLHLFAHSELWKRLIPDYLPYQRRIKSALFCLGLTGILLSLAGPEYGFHDETLTLSGVDIMLVMDASLSMDATDVPPSRLAKTKHWAKKLINSLGSDRAGIVTFAKSNFIAAPLTTDLAYIRQAIDTTTTHSISAQGQGTDIGAALKTAFLSLKRASENAVSKEKNSQPSHAIILLSDGEDHDSEALKIAAELKENAVKFVVIGVGTKEGGKIPFNDGFKKDKKGKAVVTQFHPEFLQKLASAGNGHYFALEDVAAANASLSQISSDLNLLNKTSKTQRTIRIYDQRFMIPLCFAFFFLLLENFIPARRLKILLFLLFSSIGYSRETQSLKVYLENKKGIEKLQQNQPEEALLNFGTAQAEDPSLEELEFNQGYSYVLSQKWNEAIKKFESSLKSSDPQMQLASRYNLAKSLAERKSFHKAAKEYQKTIAMAKELKNTMFEEMARKNLELLGQEDEKPPSDQNKKDDKDNKDQKEKDDQKDDKDQKDQDGQNNNKDQKDNKDTDKNSDKNDQNKEKQNNGNENDKDEKKDPPQEKPSFQSEKLTKKDAEKVMSELKEKEKALNMKMQNQAAPSSTDSKDW